MSTDSVVDVKSQNAPIVVDSAKAERTKENVPLDSIAAWIARYHADVIRGNGHSNRITIVVGADERYLASSAEDADAAQHKIVLDRADIESVEVLKGAAAIAEYGPAAEHGVVMIRTKSNPDTTAMTEAGRRAVVEQLRTSARASEGAAPSSDPIFVVDGVVVPASEVARAGLVSPANGGVASMHIAPSRILQVDVLKLPAGRIGPDATSVIVIQLKDNGR